jgi:hypothetical protein
MPTAMLYGALIASLFAGLLSGCAADGASSAPQGHDRKAPATAPATRPAETFTGVLEGGIMAIGGETTGWRLMGEGESGQLEVDVSAVQPDAERLAGKRVLITGQIQTRDYVERGKVAVLVARKIENAP